MNNELIPINNDRQTTSARSLWEFLEKPYSEFMKWFNKYKDYGFIENNDYRLLRVKIRTNNPKNPESDAQDYEITIDMAKELAMLQKTEKGKQARQYFIELEKKWNSPEAIMSRALKMADAKLMEYKNVVLQLEQKIIESKPMVTFAETCLKSKDNILVRQLAKIAKEEGMNIGEKKLYAKLRNWNLILSNSTEPSQKAMDSNYFVVEENNIDTPFGIKLTRTTKVTPKGQLYIIDKLKKEFENKAVS